MVGGQHVRNSVEDRGTRGTTALEERQVTDDSLRGNGRGTPRLDCVSDLPGWGSIGGRQRKGHRNCQVPAKACLSLQASVLGLGE